MSKTKNIDSELNDIQSFLVNHALILTQKDEENAMDLVRETIKNAKNHQEELEKNVNFKGWIFTIMHNIFIKNYRHIVRNQTIIDQSDNLHYLSLPEDSGFDTPEGAYLLKEISRAVNNLPDGYNQTFSMHLAGYKYEEIAQKMNLPLATVKSRIFFSSKRLKELLKDFK